jgi:small ligand-binding sensory domain FIST
VYPPTEHVHFSSTANLKLPLQDALHEACETVRFSFGAVPPDLVFLFLSGHSLHAAERAAEFVHSRLAPRHLIGCTAGGVVGGGQEIEMRPAVSLTAAALPGVTVASFHIDPIGYPDEDAAPSAWNSLVGVAAQARPAFVLLPEPFTSEAPRLLAGLDYAYPDAVKIGGLASGGHAPGNNRLFLGGEALPSGTVGVSLHGDIAVDPAVAQGCRPVGVSGKVTRAERNFLVEIDGMRALDFLQQQIERLSEADQRLVRHSRCLGIVMDPFSDRTPRAGDFLIRNLIGADHDAGVVAVGELVPVGRQVQLHVRDPHSSAEDLDLVLRRTLAPYGASKAAGALLFSCQGRGRNFFRKPDHDSALFRSRAGEVPLGGFFCAGEIGPVGGATFLHGYTSSFGIFRPAPASNAATA